MKYPFLHIIMKSLLKEVSNVTTWPTWPKFWRAVRAKHFYVPYVPYMLKKLKYHTYSTCQKKLKCYIHLTCYMSPNNWRFIHSKQPAVPLIKSKKERNKRKPVGKRTTLKWHELRAFRLWNKLFPNLYLTWINIRM